MSKFSRMTALCSATLFMSGCGGGGTTTTPPSAGRTIVIVSGDAQSGTVGAALAATPTVLVQDAAGHPVAGATITFSVTSGGGSIAPATTATLSNGQATTAWTLGTTAGANVITASSPEAASKTFSATGTPDVPAVVRFAATDTLFLKQGETQAQTVTLADKYGNAVAATATPPVYSAVGTAITVSATGVVTAVGPGLSTVIATAGTATASRTAGITGRPSGNVMQSVAVPARPFGLAVSGQQALVTQLDNGTVTRLNIAGAPTVMSLITVGSTPTGISVTPNGATAFVSNQGDHSVGVIDVAAGQQTKTFSFSANTFRTLVSRDGSRAYWTTSDGELTAFNVSTSTKIFTLTGFGAANGLALGLGDSTLYVSSTTGTLSAVNVKTGVVVGSVSLGGSLQEIVVSPSGNELYVADEGGRLLIVSPALALTQPLSLPAAFGAALTVDGSHLWITQPMMGTITVLDRATRAVVKTINAVGVPRRVAFDRFGVAIVTDEFGAVRVFR
jgi:DNA-binding beta-propeller fold protein YncE